MNRIFLGMFPAFLSFASHVFASSQNAFLIGVIMDSYESVALIKQDEKSRALALKIGDELPWTPGEFVLDIKNRHVVAGNAIRRYRIEMASGLSLHGLENEVNGDKKSPQLGQAELTRPKTVHDWANDDELDESIQELIDELGLPDH